MTVVHVVNSLSVGGAEVLLANSLANGGLPDKIDNKLVLFQGESSLLDKIDNRVEIINLEYKNKWHLFTAFKELRKVLSSNVDIVHSHLNPAGFYSHLVCPSNVKHIHTMHTIYSFDNYTRSYLKKLEKHLLLKKSGANLIFLSDALKTDFLEHVDFRGNSFVLNNFVSDEYFKKSKIYDGREGLRIISIGLKEVKNHQFTIEVFKYLKNTKIILDIYGDEDLHYYQQLIDNANVNIHLKGKIFNISDVITNYDLFFMPSRLEGYPLSVLEAMATGVPVYLSNILPLKELARDYAFYFNLDNPEEVANRLIYFKDNKRLLQQKSSEVKEYAEKIARREKYIDNLYSIYRSLLAQ